MKLYLDTNRTNLIFSGKVIPKAEYVELTNGERRRSGNQAHDTAPDGGKGAPLWTVDVFPDDDETMRAEALGVTVASWDEPQGKKWQPIKFVNLRANVYVDQRSGRAAVSLRADGIEGQAQPAQKAA
ncbi:hypothetical protein GCM10009836_52080 [Pseudonocardia ailaonensis]|uniref:Single-stranded DNA-binding protein n=1 Tax=Pseudonocardia ailaonensis TaxID=367279 RepID=A0ABN2NGC7_9PSEU